MNWKQALRQRAFDDAAVTALVGRNVEWGPRPEDSALPWLQLTTSSDARPQDLRGFRARRQARVQIDSWATDRAGAEALTEAVIAAFVPAGAFNGVRFGRGMIDGEGVTDRGEFTETGFVHRDTFDLVIWHD